MGLSCDARARKRVSEALPHQGSKKLDKEASDICLLHRATLQKGHETVYALLKVSNH
jgi:hypothetical protein